jgi:hypothetical protein
LSDAIQWIFYLRSKLLPKMCVLLGRGDHAVPQKELDNAQIGAKLEVVRSEAVPQDMHATGLRDPGLLLGFPKKAAECWRSCRSADFWTGLTACADG